MILYNKHVKLNILILNSINCMNIIKLNQNNQLINSFPQISENHVIVPSEKLKRDLYEAEKNTDQVSLKSLMGVQSFSGPIIPLQGRFSLPIPPSLSNEMQLKILQEAIIRYTTMQIYKERIEKKFVTEVFSPQALMSIVHQPDDLLAFVLLTTLFAKNILIRPPLPSEKTILWKNFYVEGKDFESDKDSIKQNFFSCVTNEGYNLRLKKINDSTCEDKILDQVLVAGFPGNDSKIAGAIHFSITMPNDHEEKTCYINSLQVLENCQGLGLGTLLLSSAILTAKKEGCTKVILESSGEGIPLYVLFGFEPDVEQSRLDGWWERMSLPQKMKICDYHLLFDPHLRLEITQKNYSALLERVNNVFNRTISNHFDLSKITIPNKALEKMYPKDTSDENMSDSSEVSSDEESDPDTDTMEEDSEASQLQAL